MRIGPIIGRLFGETVVGWLEYTFRPSFAEEWGGSLNGQERRRELFIEMRTAIEFDTVVETGTYRGVTTEFFAEWCSSVYSVDSHPRFHAFSRRRLRRAGPRVELSLLDSREFLRKLPGRVGDRDRVLFVYLDAHWGADNPLREELDLVFGSWPRALVMVDDFVVPGTDYLFDKDGDGEPLDLRYIRQQLERWKLSVFFPTAPVERETGSRRGCVVLCRDEYLIQRLSRLETLTSFDLGGRLD